MFVEDSIEVYVISWVPLSKNKYSNFLQSFTDDMQDSSIGRETCFNNKHIGYPKVVQFDRKILCNIGAKMMPWRTPILKACLSDLKFL